MGHIVLVLKYGRVIWDRRTWVKCTSSTVNLTDFYFC